MISLATGFTPSLRAGGSCILMLIYIICMPFKRMGKFINVDIEIKVYAAISVLG